MGELRNMIRVTLRGSREADPTKFTPATSITTSSLSSGTNSVVLITGAAGDLGRVTATVLARYARPARIYIADLPPSPPVAAAAASENGSGKTGKQQLLERIQGEVGGDYVVIGSNGDEADKKKETESQADSTSAQQQAPPSSSTTTVQPRTELHFLDLDLSSFSSIRQCANNFLARESRLDLLVLNAGIMRVKPSMTPEGYEGHFGINYVGHALFAKLLLPTMLRTATAGAGAPPSGEQGPARKPRMVIVSSEGWAMAPAGGILFDKVKTDCAEMAYTTRYGQSKLALIHLTKHLAKQHPELDIVTIHPGRVNTGMGTALSKESLLVRLSAPLAPFMSVNPEHGARNHLWASTSPDVVSGTYYEPVGVPDKEGPSARDEGMREKLWQWTEDELRRVDALE